MSRRGSDRARQWRKGSHSESDWSEVPRRGIGDPAGVDRDPYGGWFAVGIPRLGPQRTSEPGRSAESVTRPFEDGHDRVRGGLDLAAAVGLDRLDGDPVIGASRDRPSLVAKPLEQGPADEISDEERETAGRACAATGDRRGGKVDGSPSTRSWKSRCGRSMSFSPCSPSSCSCSPSRARSSSGEPPLPHRRRATPPARKSSRPGRPIGRAEAGRRGGQVGESGL